MSASSAPDPRRAIVLAAASAVGLVSLLLVPLETLVAPQGRIAPSVLRGMALIQPALLTALALFAGHRLAPRLGLGTPLIDAALAGDPLAPVVRRQLPGALAMGSAVALLLLMWSQIVWPRLTTDSDIARRLADFSMPLVTRLLYGGIVEEVLTRWGLMTALIWGLCRVSRRGAPPAPVHFRAGIILAALLFGVGHLPLLLAVNPHPPAWGIVAVIVANALPGAAFGWLFWRRGLEAAMLAHALARLLAASIG